MPSTGLDAGQVYQSSPFFSYQGHTRIVAEKIQVSTGGILFEIKPIEVYSSDYDTCEAQAKKETREGYQPPLAENCQELVAAPVILLGTPNWFNALADAVNCLSNNMNTTAPALGEVVQRVGGTAMACGLAETQVAALGVAFLSGGASPSVNEHFELTHCEQQN